MAKTAVWGLSKDDRQIIAKAFTAYRDNLRTDDTDDLQEYNRVEIERVNELARRMELDGDYYDWPEPEN